MPTKDDLSEFFDALHRKPEFKVYASLIREIDGGFTLSLAYFIPYPTPPKGTLQCLYGPHGNLSFYVPKPVRDAQPQTEPDGRISFHGHDGNHWDQSADTGYSELADAIRETFIDEALVRKILEGVQQKDLPIVYWLAEQGINVYRRGDAAQRFVKSVLPALPPGMLPEK